MNFKPNHYYKRTFENYADDIIKMDNSGETFELLWEQVNDKWWKRYQPPYSIFGVSNPLELVEYSSLELLMEDMFQELL